MRRVFDAIEAILRGVAVALVLFMLGVLALQVILRYAFGFALSWSEELALLGFAWVVVIATAVGIRRMAHARMDLLVDVLPARVHAMIERLIALMMFALGVFLAIAGWDYVIETQGSRSAAIGFPIEFLYAAAPSFGVLIALFSLERLMPWAVSLVD